MHNVRNGDTAEALLKEWTRANRCSNTGRPWPPVPEALARAVKREDITRGAELLGIPLEEHIGHCLKAVQAHAAELGL